MAKKKVAKTADSNFEQSLKQLETIVAKLEGGQLGLAESLDHYEHGVQHLKACYHQLSEAERRIELISDLDVSGRPRTRPFEEPGDESLTQKSSARSSRRSAKRGPKAGSDVDDGTSLF
ncbi:MAG: exodeoxyribonuclease VII small subunit [Planctomycetales bacterium]|nr:exodeoxyribonuclease VII small subunit [Planctomycetales bacterium]